MAFRQGKYAEVTVSGVALSAYCDSVDFSRDIDMLETTTFTATSKTFLPGLIDGKVDIKGKYDPTMTTGPVFIMTSLIGANHTVPLWVYPGGFTNGQHVRKADVYVTSYKESAAVGDIVAFDASFQVSGPVIASGIGV